MGRLVFRFLKFIQTRLIPNEIYSKIIFYKLMTYTLNLKNPRSLNEKLQWMKLRGPKIIGSHLVDKILARDFIRERVGDDFLVPLIAVWDDLDEFELPPASQLPYIIKPNHDSGVGYIFRNFDDFSQAEVVAGLSKRLKTNHFYRTKEYPYRGVVPRILCEELLCDDDGRIPDDIKFHCFDGRVAFIYVSVDRQGLDSRHIYSRDWVRQSFSWGKDPTKFTRGDNDIRKPHELEKMIDLVEKLAFDFPYVRIDLYNVSGKIYVGELTFFQGSGFDPIRPIEMDFALGEKLNLSKVKLK